MSAMRLGMDRIYGASERREKSGLVVYLKNRTMFDNLVDGYQWTQAFFQLVRYLYGAPLAIPCPSFNRVSGSDSNIRR
jgi:hypothetical protein